MGETSVNSVSPRRSRKVVKIETIAIPSGTTARNEAKTKLSTIRAPNPPSTASSSTPGPSPPPPLSSASASKPVSFTGAPPTVAPSGSVTTGTSGAVSPPVPLYCSAIATLVSQPSFSGTENSWSSASEAGPAAITPAIVKTVQPRTTVRLWARTQRVSEDKEVPPSLGGWNQV